MRRARAGKQVVEVHLLGVHGDDPGREHGGGRDQGQYDEAGEGLGYGGELAQQVEGRAAGRCGASRSRRFAPDAGGNPVGAIPRHP